MVDQRVVTERAGGRGRPWSLTVTVRMVAIRCLRRSPLPCLLPCPDPAALAVAAGGSVGAVVPSAGEAGEVAGPVCRVRKVDVPACYGEGPPEHGLAAVGAYVAGPVQPQPAFSLEAVNVAVAALGGDRKGVG